MPDETSESLTSDSARVRPFWRHPATLLWLACWAGLFVVMHVPVPPRTHVPRGGDKVLHLVAYFALAMLGGRAAASRGRYLTPRWAVAWTAIYAIYAVFDEILQMYVGRSADVRDWAADVLGIVLAMAILVMYHRAPADDHISPVN